MFKPLRFCCLLSCLCAAIIFACAPSLANSGSLEIIREFDSNVSVNEDGQLDVDETIVMDFGADERHGIFRVIPVKYDTAHGARATALHLVSVLQDNQKVPFHTSDQFNDINIIIGNPNRTITGTHSYEIHYLVARAINVFDDEPEIYWNATGNGWPFPIEHAAAQFFLPAGVDVGKVRAKCFKGAIGSADAGEFAHKDNRIDFEASELKPYEGLTCVLRLPPASLKISNYREYLWWFSEWWPSVVLPFATLFFVFLNWQIHGKDPGDVHLAGVDWEPPKELSPAEVGTLTDERCDVSDVVSTLVDLAVRGYLRIEQQKTSKFLFSNTDYLFTRLDSPANVPPLKDHERLFLDALFGTESPVLLSHLKYTFYNYLQSIKDSIYSSLSKNGYFAGNPENCRFNYMVLGGLFELFAVILGAHSHAPIALGLSISGVVIMMSSPFMPRRTRKGVEACRQAFGFKRFVDKAEKERIKVLAKDDPTIFGRLLPYAMVLGAADQWAEAFHDLLLQPPSWYVPYGTLQPNYHFSSIAFVNDLGDGMRTCASTFVAVPSSNATWSGSSGAAGGFSGFSSGGGFSGGGFGGGGGGSW